MINGMTVLESGHMTEPKIVDRGWRERLFSWPWRPWQAQKVIQVPRGDVLVMNTPNAFGSGSQRCIVAHPATVAKLYKTIDIGPNDRLALTGMSRRNNFSTTPGRGT